MSKKITKNLLYIVFVIIVLCVLHSEKGCVCASNVSKKHDILVDFQTNNNGFVKDSLVILAGSVIELEDSTYNLKIDAVSGGESYFLGIKFNEKNGDTYKKRITIKCNKTNRNFSVQDVLSFNVQKRGSQKVYIAPEICK